MAPSMAGVALAAGAGSRLAPITDAIPKPLCPVANETLLDLALGRLATVDAEPAVNVHHHADLLRNAVAGRARVAHEQPEALGTAGALANLRSFIDGRPVVVINGDTWCPGGLDPLVAGWDGESVRVFVPGGGAFGPRSAIVGTLLPWRTIEGLEPTPSGIYEVVWRDEHEAGRLEVVTHEGPWLDCGTPADLLAANLAALGGENAIAADAVLDGQVTSSAVGAGARVVGTAIESVLFPGTSVTADEVLRRSIRWLDRAGHQRTLQL